MTEKKAVIFGGHGFIGSHLTRFLAGTGEYSTIISADIAAAPRFKVDGVEYAYADVRAPIPTDLCPDATEIYNLAAVHTTPGHEDWEYFWTNITGALNVCEFARQTNCRRMVFTSSISVYGPSEDPKDENSQLEPESAYGRSKFCAERIHRNWQLEAPNERKLVTCRPAVIYGLTEHGNFTRMAHAMEKGRFAFPGRKDTIKACGYVEDIVRSFRFMLDRDEGLVLYNFAHPQRYTSEDIARAFAAELGKTGLPPVVPIQLMTVAAWGFEVLGKLGIKTSINRARIDKLNRSTNILPKYLETVGFSYQFTMPEALKRWNSMSTKGCFE